MHRLHLPAGLAPIAAILLGATMLDAGAPTHAQAQLQNVAAATAAAKAPAAQSELDRVFGHARCSAPPALIRMEGALSRTVRRLTEGRPVSIVAVGSSSTAGAGASSPDFAYPARLARELRQHFPRATITVDNQGINGEEITRMVTRLRDGILARRPDLIIWQLGSNTVLRDHSVAASAAPLEEGIGLIREAGADLVLVDPQFAPAINTKRGLSEMIALIGRTAKRAHIAVFRRFAVMQDWHDQQALPFETFVTADGVHLNDWGYACFARLLGHGIADMVARTRNVAAAGAAPVRINIDPTP